jgi:hypothetical protein
MAVIGAKRERTSVGGHSGQSCEKWRRPKIGKTMYVWMVVLITGGAT